MISRKTMTPVHVGSTTLDPDEWIRVEVLGVSSRSIRVSQLAKLVCDDAVWEAIQAFSAAIDG